MVQAENKYQYLKQIISNTRLSRIEAERRLLKLDALSKHASVYYACLTAFISLTSIFVNYEGLPFLSIVLAVIVSICTIYSSSQNYGVRAEQMKSCYLDLQRLLFKLDDKANLNETDAQNLSNKIGQQYIDIIQRTENHHPIDFFLAQGKLNKTAYQMRWLALRAVVYLLPIAIILLVSYMIWPF